MALARGDIVLVPFPFTDLSDKKVRPALIVSPDPQGTDVMAAFISSVTTPPLGLTAWLLPTAHPDFKQTGLKTDSVVKCGKLLTLHRSLILRRLGHVSSSIQREVDERLKLAVGLVSSA
jgi:mRNA interferase MazF